MKHRTFQRVCNEMRFCLVAGGCMLLAGLTTAAPAQERGPGPESSLLLGPSTYDLSGTGTAFALNFGSASRLAGRTLLFEPNFGYFTYITQFGSRRHYLFPELGIQLQAWLGSIRPYLGGGIGAGIDTKGGPSQFDFTMHAAAGVRIHLFGSWGARFEIRARAVEPFRGSTTNFGLGLTRGQR